MKMNKVKAVAALLNGMILTAYCAGSAWASTSNSAPWESALTLLQNSFTGPVAKGVGITMLVIAGAQLLRGTEFQTWMYSLLVGGLAVVTMGNASSILSWLGVETCLMI